jgi:IclR helix-turn-helix domain
MHPAAELLPLMSDDELREFGEDIKKNELQSPVRLLKPMDGGAALLLDGRNRLAAMEKVGLQVIDDNGQLSVLHDTIDGVPSFDAADFAVSANNRRRHLTGKQRADVIRMLKAGRPDLSIRAVAESTGTSAATVHRAINKSSELSGFPFETPAQNITPNPAPSAGLTETSAPEETAPASGISESVARPVSAKPEKRPGFRTR